MLSEPGQPEAWGIGQARFAIGAIARPITDGDDCGDLTACWEQRGKLYLWLADGLGHGRFAREAALAALTSVRRQSATALLPEIFAQCNQDIQETRGVAMGIAVVNPEAQTVAFCGVGNIRALLLGERPRHFSCTYGIVGAGFKPLLIETWPFTPGDALILTSDGIMEHFMAPQAVPGVAQSAQQWAETILHEWGIASDDASVLVCRALLAAE